MARPESVHAKLERVRKPLLLPTYEVQTQLGREVREVPFVIGVLGDFSGTPTAPLKSFRDRNFIQIDRDNFNDVMKRMTPGLNLTVANTLQADVSDLAVQLKFEALEDFEPAAIVRQVEPLNKLLKERANARDSLNRIDLAISHQLAAIMHHPDFQRLEGSWRGLHYLVWNSETNASLKIKVLHVSKRELFKDVDNASCHESHSQTFNKIYEDIFSMPGGEPFGALVGDYEFTNHPEDIELLCKMSNIAAAAFCPFISAASARLLGFENWAELAGPPDFQKILESVDYVKWMSFRCSEDARFVALVLPRVLARLPYGRATMRCEEFNYEEVVADNASNVPPEHLTWMNAAFVLAARLTDAFARHHWCTAIRGTEGGGRVEGLPAFFFPSDDGSLDRKCSTEIGITDCSIATLSKCGFLPLCHEKNADFSVFLGAQTTQKPKIYAGKDGPDATANAAISARLPYIMALSRFAHYFKVISRDWSGGPYDAESLEESLNCWIRKFINPSGSVRLLVEGRIDVVDIPGSPGTYNAMAFLRPHLQFEELTAAMPMVVKLPKPAVWSGLFLSTQ